MLLAIDIDGTIATGGEWLARTLAREFTLPLAEEKLACIDHSAQFWKLPEIQGLAVEKRRAMRELVHAHQHDPEWQQHEVPMPDAMQALSSLSAYSKVIYATCRFPESKKLTQAWLARYGFPEPENVYCCKHYLWKYACAGEVAEREEKILLIDDQAEMLVKSFRPFAQMDFSLALSLIPRLAVVAFGKEAPPAFPLKIPFPVLAVRRWKAEDLAQLESSFFQGTLPTFS
jgi:hypothetical protein